MLRLLLPLLLAALLAATGAASAAHGIAPGGPHGDHGMAMDDGGHGDAALAECCESTGGAAGAGCAIDALALAPFAGEPDRPAGRLTGAARQGLARGLPAAVPTGPPKG